jgi:hypothetical protein
MQFIQACAGTGGAFLFRPPTATAGFLLMLKLTVADWPKVQPHLLQTDVSGGFHSYQIVTSS